MNDFQNTNTSLGNLISHHPMSFGQKWGNILAGIILMGFGAAAYLGISEGFNNSNKLIESAGYQANPILNYIPIIVGVGLALGGLNLWFQALRTWSMSVRVYEHGLEYTKREGTQQIMWEEVSNVNTQKTKLYHRGMSMGTAHQILVNLRDGRVLSFDNRFSKTEELSDIMRKRVAATR